MSQAPHDIAETSSNGMKPPGRDCIVFVPGIGSGGMDQTVEGLAYRLAAALDRNAADPTAVFTYKVRAGEDLSDYKGELATIYRKDEHDEKAVIDIYKLDWRGTLIERYENRSLLMKAGLLVVAIPGSAFRILRAMRRPSKTGTEKLQLFYALGILFMLVVYVGILFSALWATIPGLGGPSSGIWLKISQAIIVFGAAASLFLPPKFNLKDAISRAAVNYLCLIYYLKLGEQRTTIVGKLEALIDEISRKSENERKKAAGSPYQRIHLLAYSFGSIVALDCLFPAGRKPGRPLRAIHTLVTIGCPFDFVRTLWKGYFDIRREFEKSQQFEWLNVYSPLDVLGSNFRNDPDNKEANINIRGEEIAPPSDVPAPTNVPFKEGLDFSELSWASTFTLIGLRSHAIYWGMKKEAEINCLSDLVVKMYDHNGVLA